MSRCDRRVLSHVTACSVSAVLRMACLANAILHYGVLSKCCFVLRLAWRVQSFVTVCSASDVSRYSVLGK